MQATKTAATTGTVTTTITTITTNLDFATRVTQGYYQATLGLPLPYQTVAATRSSTATTKPPTKLVVGYNLSQKQ